MKKIMKILKWYSIVWIGLTTFGALFQAVQVGGPLIWSFVLILPVNFYLWREAAKGFLKWYSIVVVGLVTLVGLIMSLGSFGGVGFWINFISFILFVPVNIYLWKK